jgi:hypothetical protein
MDINKDIEGFKIKVSISIEGKGKRTLVDYIYEKSEEAIHNKFNKLTELILDSFNLNTENQKNNIENNIKVVKIESVKKNEDNSKIQQETELTLNENDLNEWSHKTIKAFKKEINQLSKNKQILKIKNNEDLTDYIKNFSNNKLDKAIQIIPKNICRFNNYLENIIKNIEKKEEKTV